MVGVHSAVVYINYYWMVPKFLLRKRVIMYILSCIGLMIVTSFVIQTLKIIEYEGYEGINGVSFYWKKETLKNAISMKMKVYTLLVLVISTVVRYSKFANEKEREALELSNSNLNNELKFLKSQINPHFLFNALNNIYSLVLRNSDQGAGALVKLSHMLRYILYETNEDKVALSHDIEYIKNFISLQELKDKSIRNKVNLEVNLEQDIMVEPMLLIPFVENSFKHSMLESSDNGFINIEISANSSRLLFYIENGIPKMNFSKDSVGGIGLENVKKRLNILYNSYYELDITDSEEIFRVKLSIEFQDN